MKEFFVSGIVQGVGFRPFVYNEAIKRELKGFVQNVGVGVKIVVDDETAMREILMKVPVLAKVEMYEVKNYEGIDTFETFSIKESEKVNSYSPIPADLNLCEDCLNEMFEENNFRYKYFFISCTNCGPRFSIVRSTPYDREKTSLSEFKMCDKCRAEYEDPTNRRYHAQTVVCSECGPKLSFYEASVKVECEDAVFQASCKIKEGEVVAIKGVGGFHLVCKVNSVDKLKEVTGRSFKPFALMAKNLSMIERYVKVSNAEAEVLESKERPIVLLEKNDKEALKAVCELSSLGFMLPYTGLHHLLFEQFEEPLAFTSSNLPSRPITTKKEEQFVSYVLDFNREIVNFVDDSIVKVVDDKSLIIRRSRGFALNEIEIGPNYLIDEDFLAVGAELKNTFCIKKKDKLILSQHIGNTYKLENFENFKNVVWKLKEFTKSEFGIVLCDMNNELNTSKFTKENFENFEALQHHVAHGFSVAFEHDLTDFLAIVCDGTGLGDDGTVWGGEVFHNDIRIGHLEEQVLVGGDAANKEPVRVLVGILSKFMSEDEIVELLSSFDEKNIKTYVKMLNDNFNCVKTSSCGRVLDAMSVLLGFSDVNFYEGRGAMLLESNSVKVDEFFEPVIEKGVLMTTPLFKFAVENLGKISCSELAWITQMYIAKGMLMIAKEYSSELPVCFSGGVAYNNIISSYLMREGVLFNEKIPCGDGGVSAGQAAYWMWKKRK